MLDNGSEIFKLFFFNLHSYLPLVLDASVFNRKDAELVLMGVAENPAGYGVAWDFIRSEWGTIAAM